MSTFLWALLPWLLTKDTRQHDTAREMDAVGYQNLGRSVLPRSMVKQ